MESTLNKALRFMADEDGVAGTEYAILLVLIVVAAVGAIGGLGHKVDNVFTTLDTGVTSASGL